MAADGRLGSPLRHEARKDGALKLLALFVSLRWLALNGWVQGAAGEGAAKTDGRWNSRGVPVVYTSCTKAEPFAFDPRLLT